MAARGSEPKFVPRETPRWFLFFGDYAAAGALVIVWGSAAWVTFELIRGRIVVGAVSAVLWLALFALIARALHRRGRVRLGVSISSTVLFIAVAAAVIGGLL